MSLARIEQSEDAVSVLAVGVCRTPQGSTHVGIAHRDLDGCVQSHLDAVRREIGCVRARPEEVAGASLCLLPARFEQAELRGKDVLRALEAAVVE